MADRADRRYVAGAIVIPIGLPILAYLASAPRTLFYVHVGLGAFWFGVALFNALVLGPAMGRMRDESVVDLGEHMLPRLFFLMTPVGIGTIVGGLGLADVLGYWAAPSPTLWAAIVVALAILALGIVNEQRFLLPMFDEMTSEAPDLDRIEALNERFGLSSLVELVLLFVVIGLMTGLRLPF